MPQICTAISNEHFTTITARAENEGKSKGRIAAELISYALTDNESEAAQLKREIELKDALIEQLRDENTFMKSSFATQTDMAGRLLHLLTEGVAESAANDNGSES
ncbi:MAG TPA: hypothetical protein VEG65_03435 [Candidatus Bathyarchaeia archaeon]|nr:hypothetical protein [Candidatus Bathyarchaeia archaeon]